MSVHAQYMISCVGGGWFVPGRPLICHGVSTKFPSANEAHRQALAAGWEYDKGAGLHYCPQHRTGDGHVHHFKVVASYPDGPNSTRTLRRCACGDEITASTTKEG